MQLDDSLYINHVVFFFHFIPELMAKMEKHHAATDQPPSEEED